MRVLVVSSKYPPEYAGSGLRAHNTYRRLMRKYGIRFDVLTSSVTSNRSREYTLDETHVKVIANKSGKRMILYNKDNSLQKMAKRALNRLCFVWDYWREALPTLLYLLKSHSRYDLLHIFGNVNVTSAAITYAKITRKPAVVELVNLVDDPQYQYEPKLISLLFAKGFSKKTLLVCISERLRRACKNHGYNDKQIWCRPNPVDESRFFYEPGRKEALRKSLFNLNGSDILLLYLAKFMPRKNQLFMLGVMKYLPDNYKLILAGPLASSGPLAERDRSYYRSIADTIEAEQLQNRVNLIPKFIRNPEDYIKAADVFVMPTTREAFGTPFLESLACGIPVVVNDIPYVFSHWIKDGVNGFICNLEHREWADKISRVVNADTRTMQQVSDNVLQVASSKVIDSEYCRRLNLLAKTSSHKTQGARQ